ncbi:hypothetical protein ACFYWU_15200 [Streptomyces chrestomyceticus]|uniref:hypothetical protein n=1 Tax=Streptomyces chrestomyceticus TaxID=68185 RepID=UPI0019D159F5|nr:hypothetical protein [Streptomyces chrestomyceticus]
MRRRLISLSLLGSALTMTLGLAGTGTASAATPTVKAAAPAAGIQYVSAQECTAGGGRLVFQYIFMGCSGGKYDGYRIGG